MMWFAYYTLDSSDFKQGKVGGKVSEQAPWQRMKAVAKMITDSTNRAEDAKARRAERQLKPIQRGKRHGRS